MKTSNKLDLPADNSPPALIKLIRSWDRKAHKLWDEATALRNRSQDIPGNVIMGRAETFFTCLKDLDSAIDDMRAAWWQDGQRLDWITRNIAKLVFESEDEGCPPKAHVYVPALEPVDDEMVAGCWKLVGEGDDFREAIDYAMETLVTEKQRRETEYHAEHDRSEGNSFFG